MTNEISWFDEIGKKIKDLAKVIFVLETIASIILGIILISVGSNMGYNDGDGLKIFGLAIIFLGWLVA